ncbi:MAG: hypothetical protein JJ974_10640 [Phycisphaerales bacterium]|nr:hypothetical protein [Phycisphaerales bacterium]
MTGISKPVITLVGHCRPDIFALTAAIKGFFPDAEVKTANDTSEMSMPSNLLLVNRILDGQFPDESGIELIRGLPEDAPPAILLTNFPEHAQAAIEAGAQPGFGKADARSPKAENAIRNALAVSIHDESPT